QMVVARLIVLFALAVPVQLLGQQARDYHLQECIECGACAYVCPSNIPLVQYYRQEKAEIRALDDEARRAA
ncbi:4Fe-4S dicluster domain-containing protein, partial [Edwardsiella piscicida]|uniref:4Fe-4S dicluster domain-containing protein n=1 Tax=Edwardsiella piscicida TaxID=1263550 RepID=UPI00209C3778